MVAQDDRSKLAANTGWQNRSLTQNLLTISRGVKMRLLTATEVLITKQVENTRVDFAYDLSRLHWFTHQVFEFK